MDIKLDEKTSPLVILMNYKINKLNSPPPSKKSNKNISFFKTTTHTLTIPFQTSPLVILMNYKTNKLNSPPPLPLKSNKYKSFFKTSSQTLTFPFLKTWTKRRVHAGNDNSWCCKQLIWKTIPSCCRISVASCARMPATQYRNRPRWSIPPRTT